MGYDGLSMMSYVGMFAEVALRSASTVCPGTDSFVLSTEE